MVEKDQSVLLLTVSEKVAFNLAAIIISSNCLYRCGCPWKCQRDASDVIEARSSDERLVPCVDFISVLIIICM